MNQATAVDRCRKKKGNFRFGKKQRRALMRHNPRQCQDRQNGDGTDRFDHRQRLGRERKSSRRPAAAPATREDGAKKIKPEINGSDDSADQIFWFAQPPQANEQTVFDRMILQESQRPNHGVGLVSSVARKKTSSRFASGLCSANWRRISGSVPKMTLRPDFKIKTWEQTSSSK